MKSGDLTAGSAKLYTAWKKLRLHWESTQVHWHDSVSRDFEENYLTRLEPHVRSTLEIMPQDWPSCRTPRGRNAIPNDNTFERISLAGRRDGQTFRLQPCRPIGDRSHTRVTAPAKEIA